MELDAQPDERYTGRCLHCARTIFRAARRVGELQLRMIEHHILVCRPLLNFQRSSDLLRQCRIDHRAG